MDLIILGLAVLPVIALAIYIYKKDKYEKEPPIMLMLAFFLGILSIPLDLFVVSIIESVIGGNSVFYNAFWTAGIPEEFCKWVLFMLVIWRNKNFDEPFDGLVYACFIGLGFACIENIMYVFSSATISQAMHTGVMRALLSVPGHFLFAVMMGYFFGMAKFRPEHRTKYLILSYVVPMVAHGLFDYLLMLSDALSETNLAWMSGLFLILFIYFDIKMWKVGVRRIAKMQENTRIEHNNQIFKNIFKS